MKRSPLKRYTPLTSRAGFRRRNKFGAVACADTRGNQFDSLGERDRYATLQLLQQAGEISGLVLHPKVVLIAGTNELPEIAWRLDYSYEEKGRRVWADHKPRPSTPRENLLYRLWAHFGPGLLLVTGRGGRVIKTVFGRG